jgi:hypothetical protein
VKILSGEPLMLLRAMSESSFRAGVARARKLCSDQCVEVPVIDPYICGLRRVDDATPSTTPSSIVVTQYGANGESDARNAATCRVKEA